MLVLRTSISYILNEDNISPKKKMRREERHKRKKLLKKAGIVYLLSQMMLALTGISLHQWYSVALFGSAAN